MNNFCILSFDDPLPNKTKIGMYLSPGGGGGGAAGAGDPGAAGDQVPTDPGQTGMSYQMPTTNSPSRGMLTTFPQCNFSLEYSAKIIYNIID